MGRLEEAIKNMEQVSNDINQYPGNEYVQIDIIDYKLNDFYGNNDHIEKGTRFEYLDEQDDSYVVQCYGKFLYIPKQIAFIVYE